jgi:hypothetical protein
MVVGKKTRLFNTVSQKLGNVSFGLCATKFRFHVTLCLEHVRRLVMHDKRLMSTNGKLGLSYQEAMMLFCPRPHNREIDFLCD